MITATLLLELGHVHPASTKPVYLHAFSTRAYFALKSCPSFKAKQTGCYIYRPQSA